MKKGSKITFILYIIVSVCFFVSAILGFMDKSSMAVTHFCLGVCFLCLSSVHYEKYKKVKKNKMKKTISNTN